MEWFQHDTGSHDEQDYCDAWELFGDAAVSVFWTTLELYGQKFSTADDGWVTFSLTHFERKTRRKFKKSEKILEFFQNRSRIYFKKTDLTISIHIPKFIKKASNWSKRPKSQPTEAPTEVPTEAPTAIEVEVEKKKNTPPTPQGGIVVFTLPDWIPKTEWDAYVKMRRTIKKPITDDGMRLAVKALERLKRGGNQPRDVLNQSILNSWQGLFELKQTGGKLNAKPWKRDTIGVEIPADALADIAEANRLGEERRKRKAQATARGGVEETPGSDSG